MEKPYEEEETLSEKFLIVCYWPAIPAWQAAWSGNCEHNLFVASTHKNHNVPAQKKNKKEKWQRRT